MEIIWNIAHSDVCAEVVFAFRCVR